MKRIGLALALALTMVSCTPNAEKPKVEESNESPAVSSSSEVSETENDTKANTNIDANKSESEPTQTAEEQEDANPEISEENNYSDLLIVPFYEPENTVLQHDAFLPHNSYYSRFYNETADVYYESFRLLSPQWYYAENPESSIEDMILNAYVKIYVPFAYEINISESDIMSETLTYPAYNVSFYTGDKEYKYINEGIVVLTDNWVFWFNVDLLVDTYDTHKSDIEQWFRSINFVEDPSNSSLGSLSPTVLFGEITEGFAPEAGVDMDTALIRIMREFYIEEHYMPENRVNTAYRYEGFGDINNEAVMLFSFGDAANGEYEGTEHMAMNSRGKVYILMEYNGEYHSPDGD